MSWWLSGKIACARCKLKSSVSCWQDLCADDKVCPGSQHINNCCLGNLDSSQDTANFTTNHLVIWAQNTVHHDSVSVEVNHEAALISINIYLTNIQGRCSVQLHLKTFHTSTMTEFLPENYVSEPAAQHSVNTNLILIHPEVKTV